MDSGFKKFFHHRAVELWTQFCELHRDLYELTCQEYVTLLSGEILALEDQLKLKEELILNIQEVENLRQNLMADINLADPTLSIQKANQLISYFQDIESELSIPVLGNLNDLLIDIVTKIQEQNKNNQIFLNKAMHSLGELKQSFGGKKMYTTYNATGSAQRMSTR